MNFFQWCRRYVSPLFVVFLVLFAYVLFFDENSYGQISDLKQRETELRKEISANNDTLQYYNLRNAELQSSTEKIEQLGRERFYMQGPNEEIFIVK